MTISETNSFDLRFFPLAFYNNNNNQKMFILANWCPIRFFWLPIKISKSGL